MTLADSTLDHSLISEREILPLMLIVCVKLYAIRLFREDDNVILTLGLGVVRAADP